MSQNRNPEAEPYSKRSVCQLGSGHPVRFQRLQGLLAAYSKGAAHSRMASLRVSSSMSRVSNSLAGPMACTA